MIAVLHFVPTELPPSKFNSTNMSSMRDLNHRLSFRFYQHFIPTGFKIIINHFNFINISFQNN